MNYELAVDRLKEFESNAKCKVQKVQKVPSPVSWRNTMPTAEEILPQCRDAVNRTSLDARELARWLVAQDDPDWCTHYCIRWWASYIHNRGWPK